MERKQFRQGSGRRGALRRGLLATAATAMLAFTPSVFAHDGPHGDGDDAVLPSLKVAFEGEYAPGTGGQRFDPIQFETLIPVDLDHRGFASPKTNNDGNVAFRANYGNLSGAGIFGWAREDDFLFPIAITGQHTEAGELPNGIHNYTGPEVNNQNEVAFSVRNMNEFMIAAPDDSSTDGFNRHVHSAIFQWCPWDGLEVVVKQGDPAPGGGTFAEFTGLSQNDEGDIAFIAAVEPSGEQGVFLKKAGKHEIWLIALNDEICPSERLTGIATAALASITPQQDEFDFELFGPWLNNQDVVLFETRCHESPPPLAVTAAPATTAASASPDLLPPDGPTQQSPAHAVWIKKPQKPLRIFFSDGDRAPGGGYIEDWYIGQRGVNDQELVATLEINNGRFEEVVATKDLSRDDDHDRSHGPDLAGWDGHYDSGFDICARDGQRIIDGYYLFINGGTPTIAQDGTIVFPGEAELGMREEIDTFRPPPPPPMEDVAAIFSCRNHCRDGELGVVAFEGDRKPVDHYRYGQLGDSSNGNCWATFLDETNFPTGVFLAPTQCGDDNQDGHDGSDGNGGDDVQEP